MAGESACVAGTAERARWRDNARVAVGAREVMAEGSAQSVDSDLWYFLTGINRRVSEAAVQATGGDNCVRKGMVELYSRGGGPQVLPC